jgi:hypothetical protein
MLIIDNYISADEQVRLYDYFTDPQITYRFYRSHIYHNDEKWSHAPMQMSHHLYESESDVASKHLPAVGGLVSNLSQRFGKVELFRAKVNVTSPYPPMMNYESQVPHIDLQYDNGDPVDHKVLLYYVNGSDGPTYFYNEAHELVDTVYPKPGRAVIFDGSNIHAASNPVRSPFRIVINIDFKVVQ